MLAANFDTGAPAGELLHSTPSLRSKSMRRSPTSRFQLTDRFDVQVGGRASIETSPPYAQTASGALIGATTGGAKFGIQRQLLHLPADALASSFTGSHAVRAVCVRVRARAGQNSSIGFGIPASYGPDKTMNYELGVKENLFDGVMSFDASAYYIDWKSIQLALYTVSGLYRQRQSGTKPRTRALRQCRAGERAHGLCVARL